MRDYVAPRNPHPDSILWRSEYTALTERGDILHDQAQFWGRRGIQYHQFLKAGENTLNLQLAKVLIDSLIERGSYNGDDYLDRFSNPAVIAAGDALARMLCAGSSGASLHEAILAHDTDWFSMGRAGQWAREPDEVVIGHRVSPACYIADAFPALLYLAWKYAGDFEAGITANTNLGGGK